MNELLRDQFGLVLVFIGLTLISIPLLASSGILAFGAVQCLIATADPATCPNWMSWTTYDALMLVELSASSIVSGFGWVLVYNFASPDQFAGLLWHSVRVFTSGSMLMYEIPLWVSSLVYIAADLGFRGENLMALVILEVFHVFLVAPLVSVLTMVDCRFPHLENPRQRAFVHVCMIFVLLLSAWRSILALIVDLSYGLLSLLPSAGIGTTTGQSLMTYALVIYFHQTMAYFFYYKLFFRGCNVLAYWFCECDDDTYDYIYAFDPKLAHDVLDSTSLGYGDFSRISYAKSPSLDDENELSSFLIEGGVGELDSRLSAAGYVAEEDHISGLSIRA